MITTPENTAINVTMPDPTLYPINDIFYTIQGEGVHAGTPAIFVRFQGCAVGCGFCDTKETWVLIPDDECQTIDAALGINPKYIHLTAQQLSEYLLEQFPQCNYIVLTGGEPAQYDLVPLTMELHRHNYTLALETSGTATGHLRAAVDWVTVSPKLNMPGHKRIVPETLSTADEIKQVICTEKDITRLEAMLGMVELKPSCVISLQPVSRQKTATELCIRIAKERNWRLSVQVHKFVEIP